MKRGRGKEGERGGGREGWRGENKKRKINLLLFHFQSRTFFT